MKLIDKDVLVAEIKIRQSEHDKKKYGYASSDHFWASVEDGKILSLIDTLEVKEVDFIKEFYAFSEKHKLMDKDIEFSDIEKTASFFFQLGLKAQKGE